MDGVYYFAGQYLRLQDENTSQYESILSTYGRALILITSGSSYFYGVTIVPVSQVNNDRNSVIFKALKNPPTFDVGGYMKELYF